MKVTEILEAHTSCVEKRGWDLVMLGFGVHTRRALTCFSPDHDPSPPPPPSCGPQSSAQSTEPRASPSGGTPPRASPRGSQASRTSSARLRGLRCASSTSRGQAGPFHWAPRWAWARVTPGEGHQRPPTPCTCNPGKGQQRGLGNLRKVGGVGRRGRGLPRRRRAGRGRLPLPSPGPSPRVAPNRRCPPRVPP